MVMTAVVMGTMVMVAMLLLAEFCVRVEVGVVMPDRFFPQNVGAVWNTWLHLAGHFAHQTSLLRGQ